MGRCGCASECLCTVTGVDCVSVSGSGSVVSPYTVSVDVDPDGTNGLECREDGLYVSGTPSGIPVWSTGARPSPASVGYTYYDTDIPGIMAWAGAVTGYVPPWNLPWGERQWAFTTTSVTATTTAQDVLLTNYDQVYGRRYKITVIGHYYSSVANDTTRVTVTDVSNVTLTGGTADLVNYSTTVGTLFHFTVIEDAVATGNVQRKLRVVRNAGTGTVRVFADTTRPATMLIEDIGSWSIPL